MAGGKCCDTGGSIESMIFVKKSDIKSLSPFKLKRKYGKFKRVVTKYTVNGKG